MNISFPNSGFEPVEVPSTSFLGIYGPATVRIPGPIEKQLAVALARPVGAEPLAAVLRPGMRVLVIVEDCTSPTPTARLLPPLLAAIESAGVAHQDVRILVATASRRAMTPAELGHKIGDKVLEDYSVSQHQAHKWSRLSTLGDTPDGYPVVVNQQIAEADFVIGIRAIYPDRIAGFTGGYEIVDPGCFGDTHSTLDIHWVAAQCPTEAILGRDPNPVRQVLNEIGRIAGLNYVVHTILDGRGEVAEIITGDPITAYQASLTTAFQIYGLDLAGRADIVIADARTDDSDLIHAAKALYAASLVARRRGAIVLVAECPEGLAPTHPQVHEHCVHPVAEIENSLSLGKITDVVAGSFLAMVGRSLQGLDAAYLVSSVISDEEASCTGLRLAKTPKEAVDQIRGRLGQNASVVVLRQATRVFPRSFGSR
jgi:nickel-dependent lactate racemase